MLELRDRVGKIFSQLAYRRQEQAVDSFKPYRELLESLASGKELDVDSVEIVLEQANKTREDFERDIETYIKRCGWSRQITERDQAAANIPKFSAAVDSLVGEHDAFMAKWRPKMQAARELLAVANQVLHSTWGAESDLIGSCLDPSLEIRQAALTARKVELLSERAKAMAATESPKYQIVCAEIAANNSSNRLRLFGIDLATSVFSTGENKLEFARANAILCEQRPRLDAALEAVAEVDTRLRALDAEQKSLDLEKLLP